MSAATAGNASKHYTPKGENRLATKTTLPALYAMSGFTPSNRAQSRFNFAQRKPLSAAAAPWSPASQRKSRRNTRRNRRNTRRVNRR